MNRRFGAIAAFLAAGLLSAAADGQVAGPHAEFADTAGDRIRSDGKGIYSDGEECVVSSVGKKGSFFLRTEQFECIGTDRLLVLDFSDAIERTPDDSGDGVCLVDDAFNQGGDLLDICAPNPNPLTDVRILADKLFTTSSTTPVRLPFQLDTSFFRTAFVLVFVQPVPAASGGGGARVLTAAGLNAEAVLYKYTGKGGQTISLGRFRMPFKVTVTK